MNCLRVQGSSVSTLIFKSQSLRLLSCRTIFSLPLTYKNHTCVSCANELLQGHDKFMQFRNFNINTSVLYNEIKTVNVPAFAESISEGDVRWIKSVGDAVEEDEVVAHIETDKTTVDVPAPCSGTLSELLKDDGSTVTAGTPLFNLSLGATTAPISKPSKPAPEPVVAPRQTEKATLGPIPTTMPTVPSVPQVPIKTETVSKVPFERKPMKVEKQTVEPALFSATRGEHRVKMSRMRQRIAQRLKEAQNTCAMLTTFNEVDMSAIIELRQKYKDLVIKSHGLKLGFMSAFVAASTSALVAQPEVNGVITDDGKEIIYRDYVDVSVAVATPKGLVVPVLRNTQTMKFIDIERGIAELGERARNGSLAIEDMDGGTFTISNGGVFGSMLGTPIINPPFSL